MSALHPAHFAISEVLVAGAAAVAIAWAAAARPREAWLAAAGFAPFGAAGLIGAIRIAGGFDGAIVDVHQALSRLGALAGLVCLVGLLARLSQLWTLLSAGVATGIAALIPAVSMPLFMLCLLVGSVLGYRTIKGRPLAAAASVALLAGAQLVSVLLRSENPALAWHLFHLLVAAWLLLVARTVAE